MKDYLVRGMSMDGFVKAVAIRSTELVRRGAQIQKTTPNATAAFGRCLTAASMIGNMQKVEDGSMTLQVRGGGPIGTITVVSDSVGNVICIKSRLEFARQPAFQPAVMCAIKRLER